MWSNGALWGIQYFFEPRWMLLLCGMLWFLNNVGAVYWEWLGFTVLNHWCIPVGVGCLQCSCNVQNVGFSGSPTGKALARVDQGCSSAPGGAVRAPMSLQNTAFAESPRCLLLPPLLKLRRAVLMFPPISPPIALLFLDSGPSQDAATSVIDCSDFVVSPVGHTRWYVSLCTIRPWQVSTTMRSCPISIVAANSPRHVLLFHPPLPCPQATAHDGGSQKPQGGGRQKFKKGRRGKSLKLLSTPARYMKSVWFSNSIFSVLLNFVGFINQILRF